MSPRAPRRCHSCDTRISATARDGRCDACRSVRELERGRRQARGYDTDYDRTRRSYQRRMDRGEAFPCWRCPELDRPAHLVDTNDWHLGHDLVDRTLIRGPQCPWSNLHDVALSDIRTSVRVGAGTPPRPP